MALKELTKMVQDSIKPKEEVVEEEVKDDIVNEDINTVNLGALVDEFFIEKSISEEHQKRAKILNARIKEVMKARGLEEFDTDENTATYSVSEQSSLVEELLLTKLKEIGAEDLITTKEVPDVELIEDRIYHNEFNPTVLVDCMETKEVVTLRVKAKKKKKGGKK